MSRWLIVMSVVLAFCALAEPSDASKKKREKTAVFKVPTSGKILDVSYQQDYDEWWVKCREGDNIAVFTYNPRSHEWGKVLFEPQKSDDPDKKPDRPGEADSRTEKPLREEEVRAVHDKDQGKIDPKTDKRWWDPLKILKGGERIIRFPSSDN